jgi:hypothetical protein
MPCAMDLPDKTRASFCYPAEDKESGVGLPLGQEFQQPIRIVFNSPGITVPILGIDMTRESSDMKVLFNINCKGVQQNDTLKFEVIG